MAQPRAAEKIATWSNRADLPLRVMTSWHESAGAYQVVCSDWFTATRDGVLVNGTKLDAINSNIDSLEALCANTNTKLDVLHTDMQALIAAIAPPNTSLYTTALSALGNPTVKSGSGKVYAFSVTGVVEIRDNTTVLWTTVGNTSIRFQSPLVYSSSLKLFSTLGSGISLQYD